MEIGGVPISYSEKLLAEAAAERAQLGTDDTTKIAVLINPFTINSNLESEFEKTCQDLSTNKDRYLELRKMVTEGKAKCNLKCFSLSTLVTVAWANLAWNFTYSDKEGNKDLSRIFTPDELCKQEQGCEFNKTLVNLMIDNAKKGCAHFYQSCSGAPLNSCQKGSILSKTSKILGDLSQACTELGVLSQQLHEDQVKKLPKSRVIDVLQIAEGVRDECNSLALELNTQALHIEVWPMMRGHSYNLDPKGFTSTYETTPLQDLLQSDLGLSWNDILQKYGVINLVSLYRKRDLKELRQNPDIDLRKTLPVPRDPGPCVEYKGPTDSPTPERTYGVDPEIGEEKPVICKREEV